MKPTEKPKGTTGVELPVTTDPPSRTPKPTPAPRQFCMPPDVKIPPALLAIPMVKEKLGAMQKCPPGVKACIPEAYAKLKTQIPTALIPASLKHL
eukprot:CAMPEP_0183347444 /NCGR_PEP_ID=MMETSP0164_2-20130417/12270_1 /TAXON_ID=221442 /ORGANISM="Coccolithus pelagicus ssp braarudi, Strain PLY182g" /LENGTH=94 /DNA_ID=CAMNT_0025518867 /DNA_START=51 /DNA_END=331 /DNA_ORIENTATION=-